MASTALTKAATNALVRAAVGSAVTKLAPSTKQAIKRAAATGAKRGVQAAANYISSRNASKRRRVNAVSLTNYRVRRNTAPVSYANGFGATTKPVRLHMTEVIGDVYSAPSQISANAGPDDMGVYFKWPWQKGNDAREFNIQALPLNPAHPLTFPWLSNIAKLFDKYKFHKLVFTYTNNVSTARDGRCCFAIDFDTLDKEPQNMQAMAQLSKFNTFAPFVKTSFSVPLNHPGHNQWLFTFDASSTKNDLKTYNLGTLFIGTENVVPNRDDFSQPVGTLSVEYDVSLMDKSYVSPTARVTMLEGSNTPVTPNDIDKTFIGSFFSNSTVKPLDFSGNIKVKSTPNDSIVYELTKSIPIGSYMVIEVENLIADGNQEVTPPQPVGPGLQFWAYHSEVYNNTPNDGTANSCSRIYTCRVDVETNPGDEITIRRDAGAVQVASFTIIPPDNNNDNSS